MSRWIRGVALVGAVLASTMGWMVAAAPPASATVCDEGSRAVWEDEGEGQCDVVDQGTWLRETVTYASYDGLEVGGIVCRPDVPAPPEGFPLLVQNHGGFLGVRPADEATCAAFASHPTDPYVVIASDYRQDEDTPDGDETCLGEVADTREMIDLARLLPDVDDTRILLRGGSHGGCVTLQLYAQGVDGLVAAAAFMPLSDVAREHEYVDGKLENWLLLCDLNKLNPLHPCAAWDYIRTRFETSTGGPPGAETQAAYDVRSPSADLAGLADSTVPLVISHGLADTMIPFEHSCDFVQALNGLADPAPTFASFRFSTGGNLQGGAPAGCEGFTWPNALFGTNPRTVGFTADHYLFLYEQGTHDDQAGSNVSYLRMIADVDAFLRVKTP